MGKKSPSVSQPDPVATTQAQSAANKEAVLETAKVNQIRQKGLGLETYYTGEVGSPNRTKVDKYDPRIVQDFNRDLSLEAGKDNLIAGYMKQLPGQSFSLNGMPTVGNAKDVRSNVINAYTDEMTRRAEPRFQRQEESTRSNLINQGFAPGSQGYGDIMGDFQDSKNDYYRSVDNQAYLNSGAEQAREIATQQNLRTQAINEAMGARNQNINEIASIANGTAAVNTPQLSQVALPGSVGAGDYQGQVNANAAAYNSQQQAKANAYNQGLGNIASLAGTGMFMMSSYDYKEKTDDVDLNAILEAVKTLPVERWQYNDKSMGEHEEIGTYAEPFNEAFNLDHGDKISTSSAIGVLIACIQSLSEKVEKLENDSA